MNNLYLYFLFLRDLLVLLAWDLIGVVWGSAALYAFWILHQLTLDNPEIIENVKVRKEWKEVR